MVWIFFQLKLCKKKVFGCEENMNNVILIRPFMTASVQTSQVLSLTAAGSDGLAWGGG